VNLVVPAIDHLPQYVDALNRGWAPSTSRPVDSVREELEQISRDPVVFIASLESREGGGDLATLPDGSKVARLPWFRRWLWDGEFCGAISLRWQQGTEALPPHCLGHIGYGVVEWKRRRGYAKEAIRQLLPEAWNLGLRYVEITTEQDNIASQRAALGAGAQLYEEFVHPPSFGGRPGLRYRIYRESRIS